MYLQVLSIREKVLGPEHPYTGRVIFHLGNLNKITSRLFQAEPLLLRALDIWSKTLGLQHPWTQAAINGIIDLYAKMNQPEKAAYYQAMLSKQDKEAD